MKKRQTENDKGIKRDVFWSLLIHVVIIGATVISSPFDVSHQKDYGDVIKVSLAVLPVLLTPEPVELPTPITPEALVDAPPEIPLDDPTTLPETVVPEKPKPKKKKTNKPTSKPAASNDQKKDQPVEAPGAGAGSPFAGATIDNARFNYPYWFTQAFNKIRTNWRNPVSADAPIVCLIYFQVIKSGRVIESRIEESSGIPAFDKACLAAIEKSAPFPPLPRDFADEIIGMTLPFQYKP